MSLDISTENLKFLKAVAVSHLSVVLRPVYFRLRRLMSVPLSLRLCCMSVMAPALTTGPVGQAKIPLKDSPPPEITDTPPLVNGGGHFNSATEQVSQGSVASGNSTIKKIIDLNSDLGKSTRRLLKPIQGNGRKHTFYTTDNPLKLQKGLKDLGFIQNLPGVLKQIAEREQEVNKRNSSRDHLYQKVGGKKMNQSSDGTNQNGNGKRIVRQNSIGTTTVNGHVGSQSFISHKIQINKFPVPLVNQTDNSDKPKMCLTTETSVSNPPATASPVVSKFQTVMGVITTAGQAHKNLVGRTKEPLPQLVSEKLKGEQQPQLNEKQKIEDLVKDATRKEVLLEKRNQFFLRRLRRLQGKQLETQVKSQIKTFTEYQHQNLQIAATKAIRPNALDRDSSLFHSNDVKNLSTAALVNLVRKIQTSHSKLSLEQRLNKNSKVETRGVLAMDPSMSTESERKSGLLRSNLKHWMSSVDSDATESSSGGESCDESGDEEGTQQPVATPLYKRAEWKWAVDRAAIVSRWTWLQAQVSDLEYRIRQQSEIHKTIRASKGGVTLGEMPSPAQYMSGDRSEKKQEVSPVNISSLLINVNRQASKLTQSLGNCYSPIQSSSSSTITSDKLGGTQSTPKSLNGYVDGSHSTLTSTPNTSQSVSAGAFKVTPNLGPSGDCASSYSSPDLSQPLDITCQAARCRPLASYRKRKLLRTAGLHQVNHKAARLSSVRCQCYPPVMSCPMCGGRYNNFQRVDAEGMPVTEKVSLIDSSYHPVLSFPEEIPLPAHFEALLKSGEWQTVKPPQKTSVRAMAAEKRRQKLLSAQIKDHARKNRKKLTKTAAAALLSSAKLRNKYEGKSPSGSPKKRITTETKLRRKELKRRRAAQLAIAALKRTNRSASTPGYGDVDSMSTSYSSTPTPSPQMRDLSGSLSSSCPSGMLKELKDAAMRKKRFENAYDINNIVIPYSMAASTRVEKLNYKEIQTPKWRDLTLEEIEAEPMETEENEEEEDISDEACLERHNPCEAVERKKFRSFITYPPARRSRMSRESEGHSTDATSPHLQEQPGWSETPSLQSGSTIPYTVTYTVGHGKDESRRRSGSTSSSRRESEDAVQREVEPWPERVFPLPEECYEQMKKEQLESLPKKRTYRRRVVKLDDEIEFVCPPSVGPDSAPASPVQSLSSASVGEVDDPDWTENSSVKSGSFKAGKH